jgi:hypothetical protein
MILLKEYALVSLGEVGCFERLSDGEADKEKTKGGGRVEGRWAEGRKDGRTEERGTEGRQGGIAEGRGRKGGGIAEWRNGGTAEWRNGGRIEEKGGWKAALTITRHEHVPRRNKKLRRRR